MDPNRTQALSSDPNRTQMGTAPTLDPNKTMMGTAPSLNATITIKPVQCPVCKTFNPAGMMFCVDCGLIFDRALDGDAFGAPTVQLPVLVDSSGREHTIRPGLNIIGREGADISFADGKVSRKHGQLTYENDSFQLEDVGSTNGTKVNGTPLSVGSRQSIGPDDKISFGGLEVQLRLPGGISANATQAFASNKTAAISAAPTVVDADAFLEGDGKKFPLKKGLNSFGRKPENDVSIVDPYVSGKHGVIEITDSGNYVTDTGSTNGTMLNDAKLVPNMRTTLTADDVIRLGSLEFRVVSK